MATITNALDRNKLKGPESVLEWQLIADYLLNKRYWKSDLRNLPG
jgi:hypothetical protein